GVGLTVRLNTSVSPVHPCAKGVTVIVAVTGALVLLVPVKEGMFPVPVADRPIEGVLFVQPYVVPVTAPLKLTTEVLAPLHTARFERLVMSGVGFTVVLNVSGTPTQPLAHGVTIILAVAGVLDVLVAIYAGMLPLPVPERPMDVR